MSPRTYRRQYLHATVVGLAAGVAGCGGLIGSETEDTIPTNEGSQGEYDLLVRHGFDYDFPDSEPQDLELALRVQKFASGTDAEPETVFERTLQLPPTPTTRRITDAFAGSDGVHEWVVVAQLRMLIDTPVLIGDDILDAPDSVADGRYRFAPGSDRDPENNVIIITTDDDASNDNSSQIERLRVDTAESMTEVTDTDA